MNPFLKKPNFIFDRIINEAEDDDDVAAAPQDNNPDNNNSDQNTEDDTNDTEETNDDDEFGSDSDYDINTNLSDEDAGEGDATTSTDDTDSSTDSGSSYDSSSGEEEPVKHNTDIFSQLTKEEQDIKISELKKLYNELYINCDDMLNKINSINPDEDTMIPLTKITSALYSLKQYIGDYIKKLFPIKSYIENDVTYNRYLIIIQSITKIINNISDEVEEKVQKDNKK